MAANYYFWQGGGVPGPLYSPSSTVGPDQTYPGSQSTVQPNSVVSPEVYSALNPPEVSPLDIYLKVLSPSNKKEFKMYTLRKISRKQLTHQTNLRMLYVISMVVWLVWMLNKWMLAISIKLKRYG